MNPINKLIVAVIPLFPKNVVRIFASRYIAGDNINDAVKKVQELNSKSIIATMDVLGESIKDKDEAVQSKNESIEVLEYIDKYKLNSNLSIKLTMLGLNIDYDLCLDLTTEIVEKAREFNNFVRIDMEDSSVTEKTIQIYETLRKKYNNVGIVLQSYLRRTVNDVIRLTKEKANFRLCKGIYIEPKEIAYKKKQEIRDNFMKALEVMFKRGAYVGIATHDKYLIDASKKMVKDLNIPDNRFEFQMLLGVKENLRDKLVAEGYKVRIYVPFGIRWYQYSMRRFKENPNVAGQILKSLLTFRR